MNDERRFPSTVEPRPDDAAVAVGSRPRARVHQICVEQVGRLSLVARHQVPYRSIVIAMFACPMYVESAFALTPAAIIMLANVCLHSCGVIRSSDAFFQAVSARRCSAVGLNGRSLERPNTRPAALRPCRS
jgi:hypothetical protein